MLSSKLIQQWFIISVMYIVAFPFQSQSALQMGEGFILIFRSSEIETLDHLEGKKICGGIQSFQKFLSLTDVQNVEHVEINYSEGVEAMKNGVCDAVVAYNTDVGRIRRAISMWRQYDKVFRVIDFP